MERTINETLEAPNIPTSREKVMLAAARSVFMGAPVLADVDRIVTIVDWADGTLALAAQPDVPRNITVALTDINNSITGGTVTITGLDPQGRTVTETMTPDGAGAGKALTGTKIFASVTSVIIAGTTGVPAAGVDQITVGVGNVIGVPHDLARSAEVKHVYLAAVRIAAIDAIAVGESISGIDINSGTYDGSKLMWALIIP